MTTSNELLFNNSMENQNNSLIINKRTVTELSDDEMFQIDGGTTPVCLVSVAVSVIVLTCTPGC